MIRRFDVIANPIASARREKPYLLCIQYNNLNHLAFRVVASFATERIIREPSRLYPQFEIQGVTVFLIPHDVATRPMKQLGTPIANLEADRDRIVAALDLVFTGV
jgi:toxin CcdB